MQLLHECPILSIAFDDHEGWLYANWQEVQGLADVQSGCAAILGYVQEIGTDKLLNDNRQVYALWAEAAEWVGLTYLPQLADAGVRRLAWINAHSIYGRLSTSQTLAYVDQPRTQLFDDYDEAVAWLRGAG